MSVPHVPRWLLAPLLVACSAGAVAADFSFGAGGGIGHGRVECAASLACDRSSRFGKLFAGLRLGKVLEAQAVYFDGGRFQGGGTTPLGTEFGGHFEVTGVGLTGAYRHDLAPAWSVVARAGLASVRTRWEPANPAVTSVAKSTLQPLLGLGLGYAVAPGLRLSLDLDVTRFEVHTKRGSLQMLGIAAQYSF